MARQRALKFDATEGTQVDVQKNSFGESGKEPRLEACPCYPARRLPHLQPRDEAPELELRLVEKPLRFHHGVDLLNSSLIQL